MEIGILVLALRYILQAWVGVANEGRETGVLLTMRHCSASNAAIHAEPSLILIRCSCLHFVAQYPGQLAPLDPWDGIQRCCGAGII